MDSPNRIRVKIWGTARFVEGDAALLERARDPDDPARAAGPDVRASSVGPPRHTAEELEGLG
ncbi:hypothetical protein [Enhygromyxa salina]|nr:hypothetical protein [Enhygromyxa salina]